MFNDLFGIKLIKLKSRLLNNKNLHTYNPTSPINPSIPILYHPIIPPLKYFTFHDFHVPPILVFILYICISHNLYIIICLYYLLFSKYEVKLKKALQNIEFKQFALVIRTTMQTAQIFPNICKLLPEFCKKSSNSEFQE